MIPGPGTKVSHTVGQSGPLPQLLSPCAIKPTLHNERSPSTATREQPPLVTTRESLCVARKTQHGQKKENRDLFKNGQKFLTDISSKKYTDGKQHMERCLTLNAIRERAN